MSLESVDDVAGRREKEQTRGNRVSDAFDESRYTEKEALDTEL